jgi:hypothetical protein
MGIKIKVTDETAPYPRPTSSAFFCHGFVVFDDAPWPVVYNRAMKLGWKESPTGTFICPECSGKK